MRFSLLILVCVAIIGVVGCGGGGTGGGAASGASGSSGGSSSDDAGGVAPTDTGTTIIPIEISTLTNSTTLPLSMAPVVSVGTSSLNAPTKAASTTKAVSSGIALSALSDSTFSGESARAACSVAQNLHSTLSSAATNDIALCMLQAIYGDNPDELFVDNGGEVYIEVNEEAGVDGALIAANHFRIDATRDSQGRLTNYRAWGCRVGDDAQNLQQRVYLTQSLDTSVTDTSVENYAMLGKALFVANQGFQVQTAGHVVYQELNDGSAVPVFANKTIETDLVRDGRIGGASTDLVTMSEGTYTQTTGSQFSLNAYTRIRQTDATTLDYGINAVNASFIDDNDAATTLSLGNNYESSYDVSKLGLGAGTAENHESSYATDWLATPTSDSNKNYFLSYYGSWSAVSPFAPTLEGDEVIYDDTPRTPASVLPIDIGALFVGQEVWDCTAPSTFTVKTITASQFDRCRKLALEYIIPLDCDPIGDNAIKIHLVNATISDNSGSAYLQTDETVTFTGTNINILPGFTLTFDHFGASIGSLSSAGLVTLKDSSGASIALNDNAGTVTQDHNGNFHQVIVGPVSSLAAGTYTLTVGPNIEGSTQQSVFTVIIQYP